jgi:DNA-binding winged helix-turn-helix (wHTH) protein
MATKSPAVFLEASTASMIESEARAIFRSAFSTEHLLELPADNGQRQFEGFRVALIPFSSTEARVPGGGIRKEEPRRMLILPLTWEQLMAKVRREFEDADAGQERARIVNFGEITVDLDGMEVYRCSRPIRMTALEFRLLRFFLTNPNRPISRDNLLDEVWGYENYPCTRTVDNHVMKLRHKLELDAEHPEYFRTVYGVGYKFVPGRD